MAVDRKQGGFGFVLTIQDTEGAHLTDVSTCTAVRVASSASVASIRALPFLSCRWFHCVCVCVYVCVCVCVCVCW